MLESIKRAAALLAIAPAAWAQTPSASVPAAALADTAGATAASTSSPAPRWHLRRGLPVHTQLQRWAEEGGWALDWKPRVSWLVAGDVAFAGTFEDALKGVIEGLFFEGKPVRLVMWQGNRLAEVVSSDAH